MKFHASFLQVRRAYESLRRSNGPWTISFQEMADQIVKCYGLERAKTYILGFSNDPKAEEEKF